MGRFENVRWFVVSALLAVVTSASYADPPPQCGGFNLPPPATAADVQSPDAGFEARARASTLFNACLPLLDHDPPTRDDVGQNYHVRLLANLQYKHFFGTDVKPNGRNALDDAIHSLQAVVALKRAETDWFVGTDISPAKGFFGSLLNFLTDKSRKGDYDVLMNALAFTMYKYGPRGSGPDRNRIPANVYQDVLSIMDMTRDVDPLKFGLSGDGIAAICVPVAVLNPPAGAICAVGLGTAKVKVPETENHLNNIFIAQYLVNQLLLDQDPSNSAFDNSQNGYRALLLDRLAHFLQTDFVEYNSHNYQDYTMTPLLALLTYSDDPVVRKAAGNLLNYISAKVTVSSNDARRSTPFRRHNDVPAYFCEELINQHCRDPQTAFYMMLAGVTDMAGTFNGMGGVDDPNVEPPVANTPAPPTSEYEFQWGAAAAYRVPDLLLDLFLDRSHRRFYQFFHYCNTDCNDELYYSSPSFLLSAGGHGTKEAYELTLPCIHDPTGILPDFCILNDVADGLGISLGQDDDLGVAVQTTLMPTRTTHTRTQMLRFHEDGLNMGVAPNFACGLNPEGLENYPAVRPGEVRNDSGWSFIDRGSTPKNFGYYVALYRQEDFGFLEVYDTYDGTMSFDAFKTAVQHTNNEGRTYDRNGVNTHKTVGGSVIEFKADAEIVTIDGHPPYDPSRTNGDIIDYDPQDKTVEIKNPSLGKSLVLDASAPPSHPCTSGSDPIVTVPGSLTFADTCVGQTRITTFDVCNTGSGNLCVDNILTTERAFEVTQPSSGYPVTISSDFCFPFEARFTPAAPGAVESTLLISNSDGGVPRLEVAVSGTGIQQSIATTIADAGDFGNVCRQTFEDLDLTITNTGGCYLRVSGITSSAAEFKVPSVVTFPLVVGAGTSVHVPIRLQPTSLGSKSADITINSNDPVTPSKVVPVTGTVPPGDLRLTGSTDFGDVCAGSNAEKQLAVCNVGLCDLNVASAAFAPSCADFTLVNNPFPAAVSHDSCQNLTIRFTPTSCGPKTCNLRITTDDPDALTTNVTVTANTPCSEIDVAPDQCFAPTVLQSVGACTTLRPFPILNKGKCPVPITAITPGGANGARYALSGLPSFPINLQPGHTVGDGALKIVFAPTVLARDTLGTMSVTYEADPVAHTPATVTRTLNGEGVRTGARVLVPYNGTPLSLVDKIMIQRISGNRNKQLIDSVDNALNVPLTRVTPAAPCAPFQYHREYGTVSNPIQLLPGSYQVSVSATVSKKKYSKTVGFDAATCTFNPNISVNLP